VPVHEGYGLSECCSVVAVNRPGDRRAGTVGRPLPGVQVTIEDGEIVVSGPTVMRGYLTESQKIESWSTGDTGNFDPDGFLIVTGRKDNVIVTSAGRNIHPEWIEEAIVGDRRIKRCVVVEYESELVAVVIPMMLRYVGIAGDAGSRRIRHSRCSDYAKPRRYLAISDHEFHRLDLLTSNFRPRRGAIRRLVSDWSHFLSSQSM